MKFFAGWYYGKDCDFDPIKSPENLIVEWNIAKQELLNFKHLSPETAWL